MPSRPLEALLLMASPTAAGCRLLVRRPLVGAAAAPHGENFAMCCPRRVLAAADPGRPGSDGPGGEAVGGAGRQPQARPAVHSRNVHPWKQEGRKAYEERISLLIRKLEKKGIRPRKWAIGIFQPMLCPQCKGGSTEEVSLSVMIRRDGKLAMWNCFRATCGWRGRIEPQGDDKDTQEKIDKELETETYQEAEVDRAIKVKGYRKLSEEDFHLEPLSDKLDRKRWQKKKNEKKMNKPHGDDKDTQEKIDKELETETYQEAEADHAIKVNGYRKLGEEDLHLKPLSDKLVAYFAGRMISAQTLRRNAVLQRRRRNKILITFTYRRNGILIGCKYRELPKKFTQEANTEKILYGLDDIQDVRDVIIVEGEIDKLSMEEAGYCNCVSVPNGAPRRVSDRLPDKEHVSRIILATDADPPGQALAEELARRLGKERCWRVSWPKKNEIDICKDANEVLTFLGPEALRKVIEDAELYPTQSPFSS